MIQFGACRSILPLRILIEVIGDGIDYFPVSQEYLLILQRTVAEVIHPLIMLLDSEDAVVILIINLSVLAQNIKAFIKIGVFAKCHTLLGVTRKSHTD